jgi:hypothetical protein
MSTKTGVEIHMSESASTAASRSPPEVIDRPTTTVSIDIMLLPGVSLDFTEGDSCKLVEHAIRSQHNIKGGALAKDGKIYLGSSLFVPGSYSFIGGKRCQNPGEGWAKRKGAKCPCC